jgi:hypothetical protein
MEPAIVRSEPRTVRVELTGRLVEDPGGSRCRAVTDTDTPRVIDRVLGLVTRRVG